MLPGRPSKPATASPTRCLSPIPTAGRPCGRTPRHILERADRYTRTLLRRIACQLDHAAATIPALTANNNYR